MPTTTRTFRVFVSSTFEDLREERNALGAPGGPFAELTKLCQSFGARFQAIDLRWGVREEAGHDQRTMEICLGEIERCERTGIKPNFIVLLGDRYGWRPLPARIEAEEFRAVRERIAGAEDCARVDDWYRLDENAVPPEYLLRTRTGEFKDVHRWGDVETPMHQALREAARAAGLSGDALIKYEASATHQEILKGLGKTAEDRQHVFAFFCKPSEPNEDQDLAKLKQFLRDELKGNVFEPRAASELCDRVRENLERVIQAEAATFKSRSALDVEVAAHNAFAADRQSHFTGREDVLDSINEYIGGGDRRPMVVHGASGSGKSAVMARASEVALNNLGDGLLIRRFIGATPESSSGITLLRSLCEEIAKPNGMAEEIPANFNSVVRIFSQRLALASMEQPLIVFIDALDQIEVGDPGAGVTWLPPELPPHCRVVVSTTYVAHSLEGARMLQLGALPSDDAERVLALWLHDVNRQLRDSQQEELLAHYDRSGLPLYLKLAFEEARRWRSFDEPEACLLGEGIAGIIDVLFRRLSSGSDHGKVLVSRSLGYLATARYGLTEDEVLDILTDDQDVWNEFDTAKRHNPPIRRLPVIVWSRLFLDLEPYLMERSVPGGAVITFYHRHLSDRVSTSAIYQAALARYFAAQPHWLGPQLPNKRKVTELVRHQVSAGLLDDAQAILTDIQFIEAKCGAELVFDLKEDYRQTIASLPEAQEGVQEGESRKAALARWTAVLIECASDPRLPNVEEIVGSVEPWTGDQIATESRRITEHPTRLDRLHAFSRFVGSNQHEFFQYAAIPGICLQNALNSAKDGPVASASRKLSALNKSVVVLSQLQQTLPDYKPFPAIVRVIPYDDFYHDGRGLGTAVGLDIAGGVALWQGGLWDVDSGRKLFTVGDPSKFQLCTLTADGQRAFSASGDNAYFWDVASRRILAELPLNSGPINTVNMTPDGRLGALGGFDQTVSIWDLTKGRCVAKLIGHTSYIFAVRLTPDGRRVVSAGHDNTLRVWNVGSGECERVLEGHSNYVSSIDLTPDGVWALSGSWDQSLRLWHLESGACTRVLEAHKAIVSGVRMTGDCRIGVSVGDDRTLRIWNLTTGAHRALPTVASTPDAIEITPDGRMAVTAHRSVLCVWDLERGL